MYYWTIKWDFNFRQMKPRDVKENFINTKSLQNWIKFKFKFKFSTTFNKL